MQLSVVHLNTASYDPAKDGAGYQHARKTFTVAEGYKLDLWDGVVTIAHSGRSAVFPLSSIEYALELVEQPKNKPTPKAKVEEPKPMVEVPTLDEVLDLAEQITTKAETPNAKKAKAK